MYTLTLDYVYIAHVDICQERGRQREQWIVGAGHGGGVCVCVLGEKKRKINRETNRLEWTNGSCVCLFGVV